MAGKNPFLSLGFRSFSSSFSRPGSGGEGGGGGGGGGGIPVPEGGTYWISTAGAGEIDVAKSIEVDSSGNVYISGYQGNQVGNTGTGGRNVLIAKYNYLGQILWQRTLGSSLQNFTDEVAGGYIGIDGSGNVYGTATSNTLGAGGGNSIMVFKYDTNGVLQWQRRLNNTSNDAANAAAVDSSGNLYITGTTNPGAEGAYDILVAKYNSSGVLQWQRNLGETSVENAYAVASDSSGNVYISGNYYKAGVTSNWDIVVFKYNSSGVLQWQRALKGSDYDNATSIAPDSSGNVYVSASTRSQGSGGAEILLAKYNSSGVIQWQKLLGGTANDYPGGIAVDSSANVYLAGFTYSNFNSQSGDVLASKWDSSGNLLWQRTFGGTKELPSQYEPKDVANAIAVDNSGNFYFAGWTDSSHPSGIREVLVTRLPDDGSGTGVQGAFLYEVSTATVTTGTLTDSAATFNDTAANLTDSASTHLTDAATNMTATVTSIT